MKRPGILTAVVLAGLLAVALAGSGCRKTLVVDPGDPPPPRSLPRHSGRLLALLVGCTRYPNLPSADLQGPANDVLRMRELLQSRLEFASRDVVTLSEEQGEKDPALRPTRANVEAQFRRLARLADRGDQVVILLAGHGCQVPDQEPFDEEDGLDEAFLPADAGPWDGEGKTVRNAILDDELSVWLKAITDRDAVVWVIFDACHSGTMSRGDEVAREVPAGLLVPLEELERAKAQAKWRKPAGADKPILEGKTDGHLVALYASRPSEKTLDVRLPPGRRDAKPHGLLTYAVCQVLSRARSPMTYVELCQAVRAQYAAWGRFAPTPLVEGPARDREIFGTANWKGRSQVTLAQRRGVLRIDAGTLHGITEGTVLAVRPAAGSEDADRVLGHVRVTRLNVLDSEVAPCAFAGRPALPLKAGGRCEVVHVEYGKRRLRVGLASDDATVRPRLEAALAEVSGAGKGLCEPCPPEQADWVLRLDGGKVYLVGRQLEGRDEKDQRPSRFGGVAASSPGLQAEVAALLRRVARARALLAVADVWEGDRGRGGAGLDLHVELIRYGNDRTETGVPWSDAHRLRVNDEIGFRLHNRSAVAVDFTLLTVDEDHVIEPYFPAPNRVEDNRLEPGQKRRVGRGKLRKPIAFQEHLVLIAVRAKGAAVDFSGLADPILPKTRGWRGTHASPLGELLETATYGGTTRSALGRRELDDHVVRVFSYRTQP